MNCQNIDNKDFKKLFNKSDSIIELALKIGFSKYYHGNRLSGTHYRWIRKKCFECNLDYSRISRRRDYEKYDNLLKNIVPKCKSIACVLKQLKLPITHGSLYEKIKNRIKSLGLNTSHFTGAGWSKGLNRLTDSRIEKLAKSVETPWKKAFSMGGSSNGNMLMKRLVISKKLKYECCICKINKWNQKPLRLILDHIDGNSYNHKEKNLRLLCPNCNSQTDSFCRGVKKKDQQTKWWQIVVEKGLI